MKSLLYFSCEFGEKELVLYKDLAINQKEAGKKNKCFKILRRSLNS